MQALIDGDLVAFRCAASAESDPEEIAILRTDRLMRDILEATKADSYRVFLSPGERENNFRVEIDPEYKANRKDTPSPIHLQRCREYLVLEWKAEVQDGIEADDALGIYQCEAREQYLKLDNKVEDSTLNGSTIICSLDKDLLQIPGKHYRWQIGTSKWTKEAEYLEINYLDGLRNFYISSLVGDRSDNIRGVDGIGKVKAEKALRDCTNEQQMFDICRSLYNDDERYFRNLRLLWIMREHGDIFDEQKRGLINGN